LLQSTTSSFQSFVHTSRSVVRRVLEAAPCVCLREVVSA
jgi:hypothetical protein